MTPTQRSLAYLKKKGALVRVVEHWNAFAHIRQDLWGFDLIALVNDESYFEPMPQITCLIQVTSDANHAARRSKLLALPSTERLKRSGIRLLIHSWGKKGARGKRKLWELREEAL